jgi:D-alanyl-D-alanine carboxypeptidase (penicillin-binding protein 5/6)
VWYDVVFGMDTRVAFMTQYFSSLRSFAAGSALLILLAPTVQAAEQLTAPPSVDARVDSDGLRQWQGAGGR